MECIPHGESLFYKLLLPGAPGSRLATVTIPVASYHHILMSIFPNEILDLIIDAAVEGLSTRTVFGVTFTPELVALLKEIALSRSLRESAQRHLFQEIRLYASVILDEYNEPAPMERSLSIFEENPQLLTYPRSLTIMDPERANVKPTVFSPHFLSVMFPFFINKLRNLDHLCVSPNTYYPWEMVPSSFRDGLLRCITGNRLKSLTIRQFGLPLDLVTVFPPTLEALDITANVPPDNPSLAAMNIKPGSLHCVRPSHIVIGWLTETGAWIQKQADDFFTQIKSLEIKVTHIPSLATFLICMTAHKLTHLSLLHQGHAACESIPSPICLTVAKAYTKIFINTCRATTTLCNR
jgi:hypothetical protein